MNHANQMSARGRSARDGYAAALEPRPLRVFAIFFAALVSFAANAQPAAPVGLYATAGDEHAVLRWNPSSNSDIVRYEFRFGAGEAPEFNAWAEVPGGAGTVEHTVSELANGARYVFEVRAVDSNGAGEAASVSSRLAVSPSSAVEVPDAGLREHIQQTLRLASGAPVTQGDLARLLWLETISGLEQVADLAGLEFALNLATLILPRHEIADASALSGLTALTWLELPNNAIEDVSALSGLTALTNLDLEGNAIADVTALSALTSLTSIDLEDNTIADVTPLSNLNALTWLYLSGNALEDVSALSGLTTLTSLSLSGNALEDIAALSGLVALETLHLEGNRIADIAALSGLTALTELNVSRNRITDITALSAMTSLSTLHLSGNQIADIAPLSGLASLAWLTAYNNAIADVTALSGLASLEWLHLSGNAVSDISALAGLEQLSVLGLGGNDVADISPLLDSGLPGPQGYVELGGNPLGEGQAEHVLALREAGAAVVFDDGGHRVPLFPSASASTAGSAAVGFVRVINHSNEAGSVSIEAVDETGERRGPQSLAIDAGQVLHFNAGDLEQGNSAKGLRGIGEAVGDWRLVLRSELDLEVLGYARTPDGFVTSLHDQVPETYSGSRQSWVPTFNPGSNERQVSKLRLTNPTDQERLAYVTARDDTGSDGEAGFLAPAPARRTLDFTAAQLESGEGGEDGEGIGDGTGKWWLRTYAPGLRLMSLLQSPTGHLANISTGTAVLPRQRAFASWERGGRYRVPLFLAASSDLQGFLRIVNFYSEGSAAITLRAFDSSGVEREPTTLTLKGLEAMHLNSEDLESGNAAKGLPGIGAATGDWHLDVSANRRFEVLTYARTADGFVTSLHDVAPRLEDGSLWIPFFNPGSNRNQASRLRLVNWGEAAVEVAITGTDDSGNSPGEAVRVSMPARSARDYMAWELETGSAAGLSGALGDGAGKWRLRVSAPSDVEAMSLLGLPTGHITNLSTTPKHPRE